MELCIAITIRKHENTFRSNKNCMYARNIAHIYERRFIIMRVICTYVGTHYGPLYALTLRMYIWKCVASVSMAKKNVLTLSTPSRRLG